MGDNRGQTIFLSVIGVATLLVAIIGATFAYFSTTISSKTDGNVNVGSAHLGSVKYTAASLTGENILPGWKSGDKEVSVTLEKSDYDVSFTCSLVATSNGLEGLKVTANTTGITNEQSAGTLTLDTTASGAGHIISTSIDGSETVTLATGTLKANENEEGVTLKFNYDVEFPENNDDQNNLQDKTLLATVSCALAGDTIYYNDSNKTGTKDQPGTL